MRIFFYSATLITDLREEEEEFSASQSPFSLCIKHLLFQDILHGENTYTAYMYFQEATGFSSCPESPVAS